MIGEGNYYPIIPLTNRILSNGDISSTVTSHDVAVAVSMLTGIPMTNLMAAERDRVLNLEKVLISRIVGQDEAVQSISNAVCFFTLLFFCLSFFFLFLLSAFVPIQLVDNILLCIRQELIELDSCSWLFFWDCNFLGAG
jgi:hypothetical protein